MEFPAMNRKQRRAQSTDVAPVTVLWHSNAPWATTGYGTQTKQVVERMSRDGHAIAVNANYGLQGTKMVWEDVPVFPMGVESYSNDTVRANFASWHKENPDNPAHVIVLFDAWTMPKKLYEGVPVSIWTMVDHQPIPPKVLEVLQWDNVTPIAVTEFGLDQMRRAGLTKALYIPMAIDCDVYKPTGTFEGQSGREIIGFDDDDFVVSIINANKASGAGGIHRKAWAENILAFSIFAQDKPDARLYMHTERFGNYGGLALDFLAKACGLKPEQYRFVNQHAMHNGIPNEAMAAIYTATDCLLAATLAEGFGLTVLEAQACGTVAVVNNFSAQPELLGEGWLTEGQPYWDGAQLAWFNTPNIPSIVDGLEAAYARGKGRSDKARQHALKYDADRVWAECWRPYMAHLARPVATSAESFTLGESTEPRLSIYIPAYKRPELRELLASLAPQLTAECEVIISDDAPLEAYAADYVREVFADAPCRVVYEPNLPRLAGVENLHKSLTAGTGQWLWVISDDDVILPNAIADIFEVINTHDVDRIILLTPQAPSGAAGVLGTAADIAKRDEGLLIAATLTTANVVRRAALNVAKAVEKKDTLYGLAWAFAGCKRIMVMAAPAFLVGDQRAGEFVAQSGPTVDIGQVWSELLTDGLGVEVGPDSFGWNFVSASQRA
jgi:glycosyltransferase involved in cell wall biosynthesis